MIDVDNLMTAGKELYKTLKGIWDNEDFILGVLSYLPEEEDRFNLIEIIKEHPDMNDEDITLYALRKNLGLPIKSVK